MIPIVVENTLAHLEEVGSTIRDYKIIGCERGITIILRYIGVDTMCPPEHDRCVPLLKHKSPVRIARDRNRINEWLAENTGFLNM